MNSLVLTDGLLFLVATFLVLRSTNPLAFRLGCGILATAALLGVLRFSSLLPLPEMHAFFSGLGASSAFWLLTVSTIWPGNSVSVDAKYASILLITSGAISLIIVDWLGIAIFGQAMAVIAVLCMLIYALRARLYSSLIGALLLETGFLLFASQYQITDLARPGDFLHVFTAAGLLALSRFRTTPEKVSEAAN